MNDARHHSTEPVGGSAECEMKHLRILKSEYLFPTQFKTEGK
jgi:hypothetical protein